jgi:hypothetical protein
MYHCDYCECHEGASAPLTWKERALLVGYVAVSGTVFVVGLVTIAQWLFR